MVGGVCKEEQRRIFVVDPKEISSGSPNQKLYLETEIILEKYTANYFTTSIVSVKKAGIIVI